MVLCERKVATSFGTGLLLGFMKCVSLDAGCSLYQISKVQVIQGVKPDEQLVKVVFDEMKELLGSRRTDLVKPKIGPRVVLLAGLQGVGKTTACGKMAKYLTENEEDVLVVSTDVYRYWLSCCLNAQLATCCTRAPALCGVSCMPLYTVSS